MFSNAAPTSGSATWIDPQLLSRGFSSYVFSAYDRLDATAQVDAGALARTLQATPGLGALASSARLLDRLQPQAPLFGTQKPVDVTLQTTNIYTGETRVGAGASINAGEQGTVRVTGGARIT